MFKKMMILVLLIPGAGGCFWEWGRGGRDHERDGGHERHDEGERHGDRSTTKAIVPEHVHAEGCGHILRDGVWVDEE